MKDEHTYGENMARNGHKMVIYESVSFRNRVYLRRSSTYVMLITDFKERQILQIETTLILSVLILKSIDIHSNSIHIPYFHE